MAKTTFLSFVVTSFIAAGCSARVLQEQVDAGSAAGETWVASSEPLPLSADLTAVYTAIASHLPLREAALACASQTGAPPVAADLFKSLGLAVQSFKDAGYCHMESAEEQQARMSTTLNYATSKHVQRVLDTDYSCPDMEQLPEECDVYTPLGEALQQAIESMILHGGDGRFCVGGADDDGITSNVEPWTLAADAAFPDAPLHCTLRN